MHELGLIRNVLERALEIAEAHGSLPVESVHLRVGDYQNIVPELFSFAFEAARVDTLAADATLTWESVPLKVQCDNCKTLYMPESLIWNCLTCASNAATLVEGNELVLDHVVLQEPETAVADTQGASVWKSR